MPRDPIKYGSGNVEVSSKLLVENHSSDWSANSTNSSQRNLDAEIRKLKSQLSLDDDEEVDQSSSQVAQGATPDHYYQFDDNINNIQYGGYRRINIDKINDVLISFK